MDDIDRVVGRDYEPSDQDVIKARLRTVGVQEYHLSIPGGELLSPVPFRLTNFLPGTVHNDWVLYDVGGSRASVRPTLSTLIYLTRIIRAGDSEPHGLLTSTTSILSSFWPP